MRKFLSFLKSATLLLASILVFLSLISYLPEDISEISAPTPQRIHNLIGIAGVYLAFALFFIFGYAAYFLPFYLFFAGLDKLEALRFFGLGRNKIVNIVSFFFFIIFLSVFIGLLFPDEVKIFKSSGIIGFFISGVLKKYLGIHGSIITVILILAINALLLFGLFFVDLFLGIKASLSALFKHLKETCLRKIEVRPRPEIKIYTPKGKTKISLPSTSEEEEEEEEGEEEEEEEGKEEEVEEVEEDKYFDAKTYKLPQLDLLKVPPRPSERMVKEDIKASIRNLEAALSDFGVAARVVGVQKGPVVTMYELQPQTGVKIHKISALADDIALAMKSSQVRIVAPLPGRGTVGVEIPNVKKHFVYLREVLETKTFMGSTSKLTLAIGKDVSGHPVVADLREMPHLLIAGTTGSGKTVCVNSLIFSILFKAKPDEVKFILVDPKMVELAPFSNIPHLLHPIISDAKKASIALSWTTEEMERRYRVLAEAGVRNIDIYNKKHKTKLPYIIIVIDELADLMVIAKDTIEGTIQRLAQLSRAVGIHLLLATQRPSVDVVTGVIKANFPARISFKVASKVDSRTVLDASGGEKLLGKGDLLFLKPGAIRLIRVQGSLVIEEDIDKLIDFIKAQGAPRYEQGIAEAERKRAFTVEKDEMFDEAVKTVLQARQASASILQRRLRVGYTRAARLLDLMEEAGIVGPFIGSKAREIIVDPDQYLQEKGWL